MPADVVGLARRGTTPGGGSAAPQDCEFGTAHIIFVPLLQLTVACRSVGAAGLAEGEDVPTKVVRLFAGRV